MVGSIEVAIHGKLLFGYVSPADEGNSAQLLLSGTKIIGTRHVNSGF